MPAGLATLALNTSGTAFASAAFETDPRAASSVTLASSRPHLLALGRMSPAASATSLPSSPEMALLPSLLPPQCDMPLAHNPASDQQHLPRTTQDDLQPDVGGLQHIILHKVQVLPISPHKPRHTKTSHNPAPEIVFSGGSLYPRKQVVCLSFTFQTTFPSCSIM